MKTYEDHQEGTPATPPEEAPGAVPSPETTAGAPDSPPAPAAARTPGAEHADLDWMPPAENRVARFLSDVAGMGPAQQQEREASAPPVFLPPTSASPEEAERKKVRTAPFLSEVRATPMASPPKARALKRWRRRLIWVVAIALLLLLALLAAKLAFPHLSFLYLSAARPGLLDARPAPMLQ